METERLRLGPVGEADRPDEFLRLFNSNPDFLDASTQFTGKRAYDMSDAEMHLYQETNRENSRCLSIRLRETGELVGNACLVVPHPDEPHPWIGLLIVAGDRQRQGLGAEAASAIERELGAEGWSEVRLGVLKANPDARRFWERLGYVVVDERLDNDKRPVWVMRKALHGELSGAAKATKG